MPLSKYKDVITKVEERLCELSSYSDCSYSKLLEAERYSLTAGGKHLRGLILMETALLGGVPFEISVDFACAIEMVHTYSLIHDDLPEMDNDDMRRGKPTCHVAYGADTALLAGDALLTKAFSVICAANASDDVKIKCISVLAQACGEHGMLAGQMIDKLFEGKKADVAELNELHARKTGDMFVAAVRMGCALGSFNGQNTEKLCKVMALLGAAFQIKDDILDVTSDTETLGKPVLSDLKSEKSTYVSLFGVEGANKELEKVIASAKDELRYIDAPFFDDLADYFKQRTK